jgi:putative membrane protein
MIVSSRIRVGRIVRRSWQKIIFVAGYSVLVVLLYQAGVSRATIPVAIPAMLGTALSILLGFRTNSAYDRWWEARKVWGAIVNDSRTLARQVLSLLKSPDETPRSEISAIQREMIHRQIAWNFVLARSLRGQDRFQDVGTMISPAEIESLSAQDNTTNAMLQTQEKRLQDTLESGYLDGYRFLPIESTLKRMCDHMGMCARI